MRPSNSFLCNGRSPLFRSATGCRASNALLSKVITHEAVKSLGILSRSKIHLAEIALIVRNYVFKIPNVKRAADTERDGVPIRLAKLARFIQNSAHYENDNSPIKKFNEPLAFAIRFISHRIINRHHVNITPIVSLSLSLSLARARACKGE